MGTKDDLRRELKQTRNQSAYFLQAAAGSCIAFGLTQAEKFDTPHTAALAAAAILSWMVSFSAGYFYVIYDDRTIEKNLDLAIAADEFLERRAPFQINDLQRAYELIAGRDIKATNICRKLQTTLFLAGGIVFSIAQGAPLYENIRAGVQEDSAFIRDLPMPMQKHNLAWPSADLR